MRNLLSDDEINAMKEELVIDKKLPMIQPPKGKEYWNVYRITATLEYFQGIEKKYNKLIQSNRTAE